MKLIYIYIYVDGEIIPCYSSNPEVPKPRWSNRKIKVSSGPGLDPMAQGLAPGRHAWCDLKRRCDPIPIRYRSDVIPIRFDIDPRCA